MSTNLKLTGSIEYEREIDNFLAAKVIALVEQNESGSFEGASTPRVSQSGALEAHIGAGETRFAGRSLIQAFKETEAKTKSQKVAVAGYRAIEESGGSAFTPKQIIEQFRTAGEGTKNLDREIRKAVAGGLIFSETGKKSSYKITEIAIAAFDKGFSQIKVTASRTGVRQTKGSRSTLKLEISEEVKQMLIQSSMEGYPNYHELSTKSERIIWILIFAARNKVLSLNSKEIEYISKEVRDQIIAPSVPALTNASIKNGYIAKSANKYRLLHDGDLAIKAKGNEKSGT